MPPPALGADAISANAGAKRSGLAAAGGGVGLANGGADVPGGFEDGAALPVQEQGQELRRLRVPGASRPIVEPKRPDAVGRQGGRKRLPRSVTLAQVTGKIRLS